MMASVAMSAPVRPLAPGARWYVVETHRSAEEQACREIENQGFRVLWARAVERRLVKGEAADVVVSVFPRYVFVEFDRHAQQWRRINSTRGVKRLFCASGETPIPLPRQSVAELMELYGAGPKLPTVAQAIEVFAAGAQVSVVKGPFQMFPGTVVEAAWSDDDRIKLLMSVFGRLTRIEVPLSWVVPGP